MLSAVQDFIAKFFMWLCCKKTKKTLKRKEIYSIVVCNALERIQVLNSKKNLKRKGNKL
jgi:hypothetical protein